MPKVPAGVGRVIVQCPNCLTMSPSCETTQELERFVIAHHSCGLSGAIDNIRAMLLKWNGKNGDSLCGEIRHILDVL